MGSFEELLESAGFMRDDSAVGTIFESDRPAPEDVDRLYDEVAEAADVDSDSLLLEFAPVVGKRGARPKINVAVWYDGDLTSKERIRIADVLKKRFGVAEATPKPRRAPRKKKITRKAS